MNQPHIVPREVTQAKLDIRSQASQRHRASQTYTTAERIEESAERFATRPCLLYGNEHYSYEQTNRRINQVAHAAYAQGVRCGDVVALCMENRPAFLFAWLGLAKLGVRVAFLNTNVSGKPLLHALQATGAKHIVVGEECLALFDTPELPDDLCYWLWPDAERPAAAALRALSVLDLAQAASESLESNPPAEWRAGLVAGDAALYIFTSGTTGLPKAAVISHARWLLTGDVMVATMDVTQEDCFYCFLPLYHGAAALSACATAFVSGASLLLRRKFSRSEFWSDVRRHHVTICQYVGEICRFLLTVPPQPDDAAHPLRKMVGAGMAPEVWDQWIRRFGDQFHIYEGWGSTESNTNTINVDNRVGSCGRIPFWEKTNLRLARYDTDADTYVRDENGFLQHCEVGEVGEAIGMIIDIPDVVGGRFEGYTSSEATEKKILRNVFKAGDAWWSSGDLLRYDADGYCWFVDRMGDTFRWNSENVSTTEVTDALGDFPGLDAITVYGVKVEGAEGRAGMAALVLQPDLHFDAKAFYDFALDRLPRYAAPHYLRIAPTTDMTGNYKLRKVDLQRQGYDRAQTSDPLFVRDDKAQTYVVLDASNAMLPLGSTASKAQKALA